MKSTDAIQLIVAEFGRQAKEEPRFSSPEDGFSAISCAMHALAYAPDDEKEVVKEAAVTVAATAMRFLVDCV